ncbi:hypothetical protein BD626DRAFT_580633 [Schizophyllum amplum]|uniref:Uncharacterized protein n=1 Tax=Schizophyllum amplum TaxID=97359 RepID=A0A550CRD7_9AGAR|nr:hypothetical protein BD626DRAFT_580631 [Auriculariopsis ampla]TRM67366.1 hypothetical protein BD626DRAFT_580633 [Auriculariopsis ampla]
MATAGWEALSAAITLRLLSLIWTFTSLRGWAWGCGLKSRCGGASTLWTGESIERGCGRAHGDGAQRRRRLTSYFGSSGMVSATVREVTMPRDEGDDRAAGGRAWGGAQRRHSPCECLFNRGPNLSLILWLGFG